MDDYFQESAENILKSLQGCQVNVLKSSKLTIFLHKFQIPTEDGGELTFCKS